MAKGIRVNQLAKELGVESKAILKKLTEEGFTNFPNHMSLMQVGLAETVRDWVRDGSIAASASASDTAVAVEDAPAPKSKGGKKKKAVAAEVPAEEAPPAQDDSAVIVAEESAPPIVDEGALTYDAQAAIEAPADTVPADEDDTQDDAPAGVIAEVPARAPAPAAVKKVAPVPFQPKAAIVMGPKVVAHSAPSAIRPPRFGQKVSRPNQPPAPAPISHIAKPVAKAPVAPPAAPVAPQAPVAPTSPSLRPPAPGSNLHNRLESDGSVRKQEARPTVSLNDPSSLNRPAGERKPITPAPKLVVPSPAQIQGPKLIRMEKPEHVAAPRPRGPMRPNDGPSLAPARPGVGRGVKTTTTPEDEEEAKKAAAAKNRGSLSARRRGLDGRRGEAAERLKEFTDADLIARQDMLNAAAATRAGMESHLKKTGAKGTHVLAKTAFQRGGEVEIEEPITIKTLSGALGVKSNDIIKALMRKKIMVTINQAISIDLATEIALDYNLELKVAQEVPADERLMLEYDEALLASTDLVSRPAVVTILGHVDHGKTSLLDKIRSANVAAGEAGGITQHIAAWTVSVGAKGAEKRVTFIDTPGHQAFTSMRARGANMTDVVVLVVSAAEGVQPQTIESINHAKAADVPIVVAMNKIDRPDANPDMVLGQLAANGLNPVEWGGDTEVLRVSALTGKGIPELIENLDYQAQLLDLKADPTMPARGTVIEARRDEGLGPVATLLVQEGTLNVGDIVLCGPGWGRVRTILDDKGVSIKEAGPSMPVIVSGLSEIPGSGDILLCVDDADEARMIAEDRAVRSRQKTLSGLQQRTTGANLIATIKAGEVQTINLIIKADTQGSIETLVKTVTDSNTEEVKVRVIHSGVGAITESDVELAMATKGKPNDNRVAIIGFHVVPDEIARGLAERNHIDVKTYRVIYEIFDDLKKALSGMLTPEEREKYHGRAEVRQVFKVSRVGNIAGCMVIDGHIQRGSKIRLLRNSAIVVEDLQLESLKRVKDDAKEVKQGFECGIKLANYDDIKIGDVFEAYIKETFERTL